MITTFIIYTIGLLLHIISYTGFPDDASVKESPSTQETQKMQVRSLRWEDPLE